MRYSMLIGCLALAAVSYVSAQEDPCVSAGDCQQKAFAYAFSKDTDVDAVKVSDAEKIQADVRLCFRPCAESARKIAKLSIAAGDNLFDTGKNGNSGRGRGRINKPSFGGKATAPGQTGQLPGRGNSGTSGRGNGNSANAGRGNGNGNSGNGRGNSGNNGKSRADILARFNGGRGRGLGRGKRAAGDEDPSQCIAKALGGMSALKFMDQCKLEAGQAKNPDVQKLLKQANAIRRPTSASQPSSPTDLLSQFQSGAKNAFSRFGGLFNRGGRGKRAAGGFKLNKDKQGELLYMFAYAQDIAQQVCPDKKEEVMFCVKKASQNTIDFDNINVNTVKSRYCQAKNECKTRKIKCERQLGQETKEQCDCVKQMNSKVGSKCGRNALPPSPCDLQSDPPRKDTSGDLCENATPRAADVIEMLREKHGGGKDKIRAAKIKKMNDRAKARQG